MMSLVHVTVDLRLRTRLRQTRDLVGNFHIDLYRKVFRRQLTVTTVTVRVGTNWPFYLLEIFVLLNEVRVLSE